MRVVVDFEKVRVFAFKALYTTKNRIYVYLTGKGILIQLFIVFPYKI